MDQKTTFAVSVAVATTALLAACAALTRPLMTRMPEAPPAPPSPAAVALAFADEMTKETPAELEEELNKVRQAARDYVREAYPSSKTDGVFTLVLGRDAELCWAGVDTKTAEGERITVDMFVRRYVRKNGAVYFRAQGFGQREREALLAKLADKAEQRQAAAVQP